MKITEIRNVRKEFDKLEETRARFSDMSGLWNAMRRTVKCMSWGAHAPKNFRNKALRFKVNGRKFVGHVYITVNGKDLFDVFFTTTKGTVKNLLTDVYVDEIVDAIDGMVERVEEYAR